ALPISENFINRFKVKEKKEIIFTSSAKESLMQYEFYGNIRQLENVCERLVIMCDRELTQDTVQMVMDEEESTKFEKDVNIYDNKKDYYQRVLEEVQYNKQLAADKLGISRTTLWRRLNNKGEKDKYRILRICQRNGLANEKLRRRIHRGLNKGEAMNGLARALFFGKRGEFRERGIQDQLQRASALNILINAISVWNTVYLSEVTKEFNQKDM